MRAGFGVDLVVDAQARKLCERGFDVVVVVIHSDLLLPAYPYRLIVLGRLAPLGDFRSEAWIKSNLARWNIEADVWVLQTPPFYSWAPFLNGPVIIVEHGAPPGELFPAAVAKEIDDLVRERITQIYPSLMPYDALVSISEYVHNWLPNSIRRKSSVIYNGADHYCRPAMSDVATFRRSLGVDAGSCMVLWVGRMQIVGDEQPYKGFRELRALIPLLKRRAPTAAIVLAGRISQQDKHRLEQDGCQILANLPAEALACAYAAADLVINLSLWEGFNLSLLEAQFQGTPVIAYDVGPHSEIVRNEQTGVLAKSPQELFRSATKLILDPAFRERLASGAGAFAQQFTWKRNADELEKLILSCAAQFAARGDINRRAAPLAAQGQASPNAHPFEINHVGDLLKLDGAAFVRAARQELLGLETNEDMEALWIRRLRRSAGKRTILLEMADVGRAAGALRKMAGFRTSLSSARIERFARNVLSRKRSTASEWMILQDEIFVQHAYRILLRREADADATIKHLKRLRNGQSRLSLLAEIWSSEEGRRRLLEDPELCKLLISNLSEPVRSLPKRAATYSNASTEWSGWQALLDEILRLGRSPTKSKWFRFSEEEFVRQAYRSLLDREPEPEALRGRAEQLRNGRSRRSLLAEVRYSDEGRLRRVRDLDLRRILLPVALNRSLPDPPRHSAHAFHKRTCASVRGLIRFDASDGASVWFRQDDGDFVKLAYRTLLGREADHDVVEKLCEQLRRGGSRRGILAEIRFSPEGRTRRLYDPGLRSLLVYEAIWRSPPFRWLGGASSGEYQPENAKRLLRRIESKQKSIAADLVSLRAATEAATDLTHALASTVNRFQPVAIHEEVLANRDLAVEDPRRSHSGSARRLQLKNAELSERYVLLVAPGASVSDGSMAYLQQAVESSESDLVFGDEVEVLTHSPFQRVRVLGPLSHPAVLRNPDLGAVIAVRKELLSDLELEPLVALTGNVVLRILSLTHTITYVPFVLGKRATEVIVASRAHIGAVRSYVDRLPGRGAVSADSRGFFDVRFAPREVWRAAIVVVANDEAVDFENWIAGIKARTPAHQYHLSLAYAALSLDSEVTPVATVHENYTRLDFTAGTSYSRLLNESVKTAPEDCNLIVVLHYGALPTSDDWLERLAESAFHMNAGAVAAKTVYPNGQVRHAGLALGGDAHLAYVARFMSAGGDREDMYLDPISGLREVFAVSHHCTMMRREVFDLEGAFDAMLGPATCDVEFCCRMHALGFSILVDGRVEIVQPDPHPRRARVFPGGELDEIKARYKCLNATDDPHWSPLPRGTDGSKWYLTVLPPMENRNL